MAHNFKELKVWQKSIELTFLIYRLTTNFPSNEEFGLKSQMHRCAVSIPSNIAEGSGRNTNKDFERFLSIALGSAFELETQIILAKGLFSLNVDEIELKIDEVQKMIVGFKKSIEKIK